MAEAPPKGYLVLSVMEASGLDRDDAPVWPEGLEEVFVKVDLRGGARPVKAATARARVDHHAAVFEQPLVMEVPDQANELRVMLCKEKRTPLPDGTTKRGTQVVAACGIYVDQVIGCVPIDKYFELFQPGPGSDGGFIRLGVDFTTDPPDMEALIASHRHGKETSKRKGRGWLLPVLLLLAGGALAGGAVAAQAQRRKSQASKPAAAPPKGRKLW